VPQKLALKTKWTFSTVWRSYCDGCETRLWLRGRIQSDDIPCVQSAVTDGCGRKILDLSEVTLVHLEVVRFLINCEE